MRLAGYGLTVGLMLLGVGLAGCSEGESQPAGADTSADQSRQVVVHEYPLRGRVVSLIDETDPASELKIHHEAIDDFKMGDGELSPMGQMVMPFAPGPGETMEGIAVGDAVSFVFEMQWEPAREMRAVDFKKLPADTVLNFETTE